MVENSTKLTKQCCLVFLALLGLTAKVGAAPIGATAAVSFPISGVPESPTTNGYLGRQSNYNMGIGGGLTFGWAFNLSGSQTVTYLGLWDAAISNTTVGIWNSAGNLLTSGVFGSNYDGVDTSDIGNSGFAWLPISPVSLGAGAYTIGAYSPSDQLAISGISGLTIFSGLTILNTASVSNNNFSAPTVDLSSAFPDGIFGANLAFAPPPPPVTPIPATVWLLISSIGGLGMFARKRKQA